MRNKHYLLLSCLIALVLLDFSCVSSVDPEFDYADNLLYVDGFLVTEPNMSYVSIKESYTVNNKVEFREITDALVSFENPQTGEIVKLDYISDGNYKPVETFTSSPGEEWKLYVELADGRKVISTAEITPEKVPFSDLKATFKKELKFESAFNDFIPGHSLSINIQDPADEVNYYLWKYTSYERLVACKTCNLGVLRNGECEDRDLPSWATQYYSYLCFSDCWMMRFASEIPVFSDQFSNGEMIEGKEVAELIFYRKQDILVELQQYSISESTYKYFKTINDLVSQSGGLNAPTPTALLGNLVNTGDSDDVVLGQFSTAAVHTSRIYIDRDDLPATPVTPDLFIQLENCPGCPTNYPCEESSTRTGTKPVGWP